MGTSPKADSALTGSGRRAKTYRVDVAATFTLRAYVAGDPSVCRFVEIPTQEAEDAKRRSRERTRLASERSRRQLTPRHLHHHAELPISR